MNELIDWGTQTAVTNANLCCIRRLPFADIELQGEMLCGLIFVFQVVVVNNSLNYKS